MATTRKALAYSKKQPVVNTRHSRKQQFSYIKAVPVQKIVKFNMGDIQAYQRGDFGIKMTLSTEENIQIRDLALESVRQTLLKDISVLFQKNFFFRCNVFPHNILRNNRVFSGASKGERVQTGMTLSFGTPEGRAAIVKRGNPIFTVYFNGEKNIAFMRKFFRKAAPKLPCKSKVSVEIMKK
ncbi:MAG: 50S ribosomal protein L16 [Candidatus Pacearchaeota archaeon]